MAISQSTIRVEDEITNWVKNIHPCGPVLRAVSRLDGLHPWGGEGTHHDDHPKHNRESSCLANLFLLTVFLTDVTAQQNTRETHPSLGVLGGRREENWKKHKKPGTKRSRPFRLFVSQMSLRGGNQFWFPLSCVHVGSRRSASVDMTSKLNQSSRLRYASSTSNIMTSETRIGYPPQAACPWVCLTLV